MGILEFTIGMLVSGGIVGALVYGFKRYISQGTQQNTFLVRHVVETQASTVKEIGSMAERFEGSIEKLGNQFSSNLGKISNDYQQSSKERAEQMKEMIIKLNSIEYSVNESKNILYPLANKVSELYIKCLSENDPADRRGKRSVT